MTQDHDAAVAAAESTAREALAAAESTGRDVLAGAELAAREALAAAESTRRDVLAGAESSGRDALAVAELTARDALAVAESTAREALAAAESTGRDVLAAAALELTGRVVELVERVEATETGTRRFRRIIVSAVAATGVAAVVTIPVTGVVINRRVDAATVQQDLTRARTACPLYGLIIGASSAAARDSYPKGPAAYGQALDSVRRQSERIGCPPS